MPRCCSALAERHKVFAGLATRGKSSTGWFFGFKLHIVTNHGGELLDIKLTAGNVDDRKALSQHDWLLVSQAVTKVN
jgi:Transposase DDE domain